MRVRIPPALLGRNQESGISSQTSGNRIDDYRLILLPETCPRPWCSGNPSACQAEDASSILAGRFSDETKQETQRDRAVG